MSARWRYESHYGGRRRGSFSAGDGLFVIEFKELDDARFLRKFKLKPNAHYKAIVRAVGTNIVPQNEGGVGANICVFGTWSHSTEFGQGTGTFDGDLSVEFCVPDDGIVEIGLRLGYWGCEAKGHVVFSNLRVEELDYVMLGAEQVRMYVDIDTLTCINPDDADLLIQRLTKVYSVLSELYGKIPFDGKPIGIELRHGMQVWAYAGNPITWNYNCCLDYFRDLQMGDDACFGMIHEMGHNFDMAGLNINPELMANFNLCYAVETLNLPIHFDNEFTVGRGLQDGFYRRCYENTIVKGKYHHDGLLYCLLRIKDAVGWAPYKQVMRKFAAVRPAHQSPPRALDLWLRMVSQACGRDVRAIFKPGEYDLIMRQENL